MEAPVCSHNLSRSIRTANPDNAIRPIGNAIYWHIDESTITSDLEKYKVVLAFEKTFQKWQPYFSPIELLSTSDRSKAAIVIHFMENGNPKLPEEFGSGVLAYAFFPRKGSLGIHSDMYFNDAYRWAEMHKPGSINLFKVAVHEVGHSFGLEHSIILTDIMYPTYQPNNSVVISSDTAAGIEKLYGAIKDKISSTTPSVPPKETPRSEVLPETLEVLRRLFPDVRLILRLSFKQIILFAETLGVSHRREDGRRIRRGRIVAQIFKKLTN